MALQRKTDKNAEDKTVLYLTKEIPRIENNMKLITFLSNIKVGKDSLFTKLVDTFRSLHSKSKEEHQICINTLLQGIDKDSFCDHIFMCLIEATFVADQANQHTQNYGYCLKLLKKWIKELKLKNPVVKMWLARHLSIYYLGTCKPLYSLKMKALTGELESCYRDDHTRPDMWKFFACKQLFKLHLYEHYRQPAHPTFVDEGEKFIAKALKLLEDMCRFAECDPEHNIYPRNYDFLWPHIQKCIVCLKIPGFQMRLWKNNFPNSTLMCYNDFPELFRKFYEGPISTDNLAKAVGYWKTLMKISNSGNLSIDDIDDDFLKRTTALIDIGIKVRSINMCSEFSEVKHILLVMSSFIKQFHIREHFQLREYTYARPETILPVFMIFLRSIQNSLTVLWSHHGLKVTNRECGLHCLKMVTIETSTRKFTEENLNTFSLDLSASANEIAQNSRSAKTWPNVSGVTTSTSDDLAKVRTGQVFGELNNPSLLPVDSDIESDMM